MTKKESLPQGFLTRPATMDDLENTVNLINYFTNHYIGHNETSIPNLRRDWETPGFKLENDTCLVINPQGEFVGYQEVWTINNPPVHPYIWGCVHPHFESMGIGSYLLTWGEKRAHQELSRVSQDLRVAIWADTDDRIEPAKRLLEEHGLYPIRYALRMMIEMSAPPPKPDFPKDIFLRSYNPKRDAKAVYQADNDAFRDHFGFIEESFEDGFPKFIHYFTNDETYDPTLWFIATSGDEIAGICLCNKWSNDDRDAGYIASLGVRRPWRKKGLGMALLNHAFGEFYRRGKRKVSLDVDAENLTGALRLYKKVGMRVSRKFVRYEKELRPGKEISVQSLDETP
ncbi:MAG TPA: GNAT family N-acetyltransferase [Anaerolineae bacterium]|nr:GNAT family N-acetyltransferase [Anaerolineae bacterium]